jgi:phage gp36-like protein
MTYATKADRVRLYGEQELLELTDRADPPAGEIDDAVIAGALSDAEAEINSYISTRVTTPVTPVPTILGNKTCAIARYFLWKDRASEKVTNDYNNAIAWAKGVSAGAISLGNAGDTPTTAVGAGAPKVVFPKRKFSEGC